MMNKEAMETLKANYPSACYGQLREAVDMAISALEKQIPKKAVRNTGYINPALAKKAYLCPICFHWVEFFSFCPKCGQAIDLSEDE